MPLTFSLFRNQYRNISFTLLISLLSLLASCKEETIEPAPSFGRIEGKVLDARTGTALANVTITTNPATTSVVTDSQGLFQITDVPVGRITITSKRTGYQQDITSVTVVADQMVMASIQLDKSAAALPPSPPNNPRPADKATDQPTQVRLYWHPVNALKSDSLRYDVVLFESNIATGRQLATNTRDTTVLADQLKFNTVYYWQVTVRNPVGATVKSDIWSFRTGALPDNRYLFAREANGNTDVYSTNEAGTSLQRLTSSAFIETAPQLSPNRDRIAYTSNATGQFQIYTMNRDGSDVRQVTLLPVDGYFNQGIGYRWSPDGAQLIYSSYDKLYRINRDGTGLTLLATAPADRHFRECDWTAQGNRILVQTVGISVYDSELYLLHADGSNRTLLVGNLPGRLDSPSFSVDGKRVMYTRDIEGFNDFAGRQLNAHIFTQNLDGSGLVDVSAGIVTVINTGKPLGFNDVTPRYSPDGARIIFVQVNNVLNSTPDVYTVELDGRMRTRLFQNAFLPDWR